MKEEKQNLITRPPIVVVMGHIDHGKSKLLDYIRKTSVVEGEAGGITQHIGAYEVEVKCSTDHTHKTRKITFLDTPGHEAFSKMRARGAKIADAAVLVIAADEGVKPQTIEAYNAIKKADIPLVIVFNKMDKPNADPEKTKGQLAEQQIFVEGYGGNIPYANISATTGHGVNELLDLILLLTEMEELKANPKENASGTIIESKLGQKRGISATLLIQNGAMKKGMFVVAGNTVAPVRIFENFKGLPLEEASFSSPVKIIGFDKIPEVGMEFKTFNSKKEAEKFTLSHSEKLSVPLKTLKAEKGKIIIPIVIKTDMTGSLEAIEKELMKLQEENVSIMILRKDIGKINEDDTKFASSAQWPVILGFNVEADNSAKDIAEKFAIRIFTSDIIYKISDWLKEEIKTRKQAIQKEETAGTAEIIKTFGKTKNKQVVGGKVIAGKISEGNRLKIKRNDSEIGEGKIVGLQHNKISVKEVNAGEEFGMMLETKTETSQGDILEIAQKK